jgi:hypothetical protein
MTKETAPWITFMALESSWMVFYWVYMLIFLIMDGHHASATLVSFAIFANFVINYLWYEFYNDKLYKNDVMFQNFDRKWPKTTKGIKYTALLINFDFFRISYTHLFNLPQLKANMLKRDKNYKRINRYELFQITFCYLLVTVAASYNLFYTWTGRQIYWIDVEWLITGILMVLYKLVIIFKSEKHYILKVLDLDGDKKDVLGADDVDETE